MRKCIFQDCNNEATTIIPCWIGPKEIKEDIHVCDFHFHYLRRPQPFISMEIKEEKGTTNDIYYLRRPQEDRGTTNDV